jgi:hypothetical protein
MQTCQRDYWKEGHGFFCVVVVVSVATLSSFFVCPLWKTNHLLSYFYTTQKNRIRKQVMDEQTTRWKKHLAWSNQQGRILTANGQAASCYTADRGFDFEESELPHYHLMRSRESTTDPSLDTRTIFREWRQKQGDEWKRAPVVGVWKRTLFYGGWEYTTDADEQVFNIQTPSLFVDLRLPTTRLRSQDLPNVTSLDDLSVEELRKFARQHVFGGYTVIRQPPPITTTSLSSSKEYDLVCTRHHVMDWNFVGVPRNRPNKWYVEVETNKDEGQDNKERFPSSHNNWKEWAYATDPHGQQYYCEWWQSIQTDKVGGDDSPTSCQVLALRLCRTSDPMAPNDGILVAVGSHFNYLLDYRTKNVAEDCGIITKGSLVDTVDALLEENNVEMAKQWLNLQGGYGEISPTTGWTIPAATEFWKEGTSLFRSSGSSSSKDISVQEDVNAPYGRWVLWKGYRWEIVEWNDSPISLIDFFGK